MRSRITIITCIALGSALVNPVHAQTPEPSAPVATAVQVATDSAQQSTASAQTQVINLTQLEEAIPASDNGHLRQQTIIIVITVIACLSATVLAGFLLASKAKK